MNNEHIDVVWKALDNHCKFHLPRMNIYLDLLQIPPDKSESTKTLRSHESNKAKPCAKCGNPKRHIAKSGRCYTSLCKPCRQAQAKTSKENLKR